MWFDGYYDEYDFRVHSEDMHQGIDPLSVNSVSKNGSYCCKRIQ